MDFSNLNWLSQLLIRKCGWLFEDYVKTIGLEPSRSRTSDLLTSISA